MRRCTRCRLGMALVFATLPQFAAPLSGQQERPCADETAVRALVHAYVLSSVLHESQFFRPDEPIEEFVPNNSQYFADGGPVVKCAQALAQALVGKANAMYDPHAYEHAMSVGPSEFASDVANSINAPAAEVLTMGLDMQWLSEVLPSLAQGNVTPYQTTGTEIRIMQKRTVPIMDMLLADPENRPMLATIKAQLATWEAQAERNLVATVTLLLK